MTYGKEPGKRPTRRTRPAPRRGSTRPRTPSGQRRALRREVVSTVGVLADGTDFAAMRGYQTFAFDSHPAYLRQVEALLRSLADDELSTRVALFDPEDFAAFCSEQGLDPDTALSRSRYTAQLATQGATIAYTGQPLETLLPGLISAAVRRATWEYATTVLADIGRCAHCGQDIGTAAFDRAAHLLVRLLEAVGPGVHHLVCSVQGPQEQLLAVLHTEADSPGEGPAPADTAEAAEFTTVLATAIALDNPGGVVLRTSTPGAPDRLRGWRLQAASLHPLTEAEVFNAYCTDATTGEPLPPEPGVEYRAGFDIGADDPEPHH
ncbi:hypothetical protein ACFVIM_17960 [Streptomyces sp. NPDC057638]|uniref:hypothetical protein n=1 Tax=Streptomyces sp. NPDC057638 TaxID=3346190 RepID=UPI0036BB58E0